MGTKKLDNRELRDRFLDLIRLGHGRYDAAKAVGIIPETYRLYYKGNADFRDEVEAAVEASVEPIMKALHEDAKAGDISAAKLWLQHNAPAAKVADQKIDVQVTHQADPETLKTIGDLRARLEGRSAPALPAPEEDIIEGEILD